ncbi:2-succinyl-6-hydroxy-2,4-cyclohexadiene-1-carboxylate synthase [compost metagenome]
MHRPSSYNELSHWRRYPTFFPERFQQVATEPVEERWSWRGLDVHLDRYEGGATSPKVIFLHGAGGNGRVFGAVGAFLQAHGYTAIFPDMPGYGLTSIPPGPFDYELWIDLAVDLVEREANRDGRPIVVFGASVGGMLAYEVAARSASVRGVIATMLADPRDAAVRERFALVGLVGRLAPDLMRPFAWLLDGLWLPVSLTGRMELIANDPAFVQALVDDPLAAGALLPLRFIRTMLDAKPTIEPEAFTHAPVLLVHPAEDRWTNVSLSLPFFERLGCEKRLVMLEGAGHAPIEEPGVSQLEQAAISFLEALR